VRERVIERFDHTNLNLDAYFKNRVPTTENLSKAVFELLDGSIKPARVVQVRVEETGEQFL